MTVFLTPSGSATGLVDYSLTPVWELDLLFAIFALLSFLHAMRAGGMTLWLASLLGGLACESACIRAGGTHCHHVGLVDVSACSSGNSVLFYGPWVYSAVQGARRVAGSSAFSQAMWTGLLTGLICWPYEMQGPLARLWKWPAADGLVMPASAMGDFPSLANDPQKGYYTNPHALQDLGPEVQIFGFPVHAPFFDMAYGVGIGASFALLPSLPSFFHTIVLGPILGVLYIRLPIALASMLKVSVLVTDPGVMILTVVFALSTARHAARPSDWLLVSGPLLTQLYWGAYAFRGVPFPPELQCIILLVTSMGLWIWLQMGTSTTAPQEARRPGKEVSNGKKSR